jgi:hypothetical protein
MAAKKLSKMGFDVKSVIGGFNAYRGKNRSWYLLIIYKLIDSRFSGR